MTPADLVQATQAGTPMADPAVQKPGARAVVDSLRQHGLSLTAENYAVWHAYMAGAKPALTRAIEIALSNGLAIEDRALRVLHAHHFAPVLETRAMRDVAERGLRTLSAMDVPARGPLRASVELLRADMEEVVRHSNRLTQELAQSAERIAQLERFLDDARQEASTDGLTGIANRRAFDAAVRARAGHAMNDGSDLALILADIDNFKQVNDRWGHAAGDEILRMVAGTLVDHVRGTDLVARHGGEEFAVLLPATGQGAAMKVADHLRLAIEREALEMPGGVKLQVTVSAGAACYVPGESLAGWLARADGALYRAKSAGRNRAAFADPGQPGRPPAPVGNVVPLRK